MKYIKFYKLFEESQPNLQLPHDFIDECKPFIEKMKKCHKDLYYRGVRYYYIQKEKYFLNVGLEHYPIYKTTKPERRRPVDTPLSAHNSFNEEFNKVFGWNVRDGIFTFRNSLICRGYGDPYIFVPIGDFDFCWSQNYQDFYSDLEYELNGELCDYDEYLSIQEVEWFHQYGKFSGRGKMIDDEWVPDVKFKDYVLDQDQYDFYKKNEIKNIVAQYDNENLDAYINHEVSFNCKEYYLFHIAYEEKIKNTIWQ